jgi:hypothetical protein
MALEAGIGDTLTVSAVTCTKVGGLHYTCDIRSTSKYGDGDSVADAVYRPKTQKVVYDIRP